jgi:hypothetical protein
MLLWIREWVWGAGVLLAVGLAVCGEAWAAGGVGRGVDEGVQRVPEAGRKGIFTEELAMVDPAADGWPTEAFHEEVKPKLKAVLGAVAVKGSVDAEAMAGILAEGFRATPLRPASVEEIYRDGRHVVVRGGKTDSGRALGFAEAVAGWQSGFAKGSQLTVHLKIHGVELAGASGETGVADVYVDTDGAGDGGWLSQTASWRTHWVRTSAEGPWKLSGIALTGFEETLAAGSGGRRQFADVTQAVLGGTAAWGTQILRDVNYWRPRVESGLGMDALGHCGLALGDANGDGLDDLFAADMGGLPKRLYLHQPDGTVREVAAAAGVDLLDRVRSALFLDLDNDGDQDLVMAREFQVLVFENGGNQSGGIPQFRVAARLPVAPNAHSLCAADFDEDGDLDLYVCCYGASFESFGEESSPVPWYDANNGAANSLFRNEARPGAPQWKFTDVTSEVGLDENNRRFSFAGAWVDHDQDGDLDLYVVNDFGRNNLYRQEKGADGVRRFRDVAAAAGAEDPSAGMGVAWGDPNRDGHPDVHVSNMFSGAGNRIAFQPKFGPGSSAEAKGLLQRFARGNTLLESQGDGTFRDVSVASGITLGRWAWGSVFADINNDGWEDILVANGLLTGVLEDDL